nr:hypothetical protein [Anaerolineae bacterium]
MESRVKVKVIKPEQGYVDNNPPPALANLLRATGPGIIIYLAERYGLRRMPGLSPAALADRLLRELSQEQLLALYNDLIAAHFGAYTIDGLLQLILNTKATTGSQLPPPNLADMPPAEAVLVEHREKRWWFTMHGYDVIIDLNHRYLACNCHYFRFHPGRASPVNTLLAA